MSSTSAWCSTDRRCAASWRPARSSACAATGPSPTPAIAAYLADHQRLGIPFNAVYGPALPEGEVLPELLSPAAVVEAVARAKRAAVR